ncbi:hypothetical protein JVU11DRAFT_4556 [Chiua virens]|nr:hypothetical protein JVU11DRAFT_4556 [Chiua virens]
MTGLLIPDSYLTGNPEMALHIIPTALVTLCVRGYFVSRIYLLVGRKIVVLFIWGILGAVEFTTALIYVSDELYIANGKLQIVGLAELGVNPFLTVGSIKLCVAAGMDVMIATCMTLLFARKRARAKFTNTVHVLRRLTVFSVNTGVWPASLALLTIILLHAFPTNIINYLPYLPLCSVYCNTLLANLNVRAYIKGSGATHYIEMDLFSTTLPRAYESMEADEQQEASLSVPSAKEEKKSGTEPQSARS